MKNRLAPIGCCLLLATSVLAPGDIIRLKDGTELEGKILSESFDSVSIEVGTSIKEVKKVPRTEITAISKQTPDETAWDKLKDTLPTDDLLTVEDYEKLLEGDLATFPIRYKDSEHLEAVQAIVAKLEEEKAKVEAGALKIEGKWVTPDQGQADPYNYKAYLESARMKKAFAEGKWVETLRHFDTLDQDYRFSEYYEAAVEIAKQALPKYAGVLARMERENAAFMKQREENLRPLSEAEREKTEAAFEKQMAPFYAKRAEETESGRTWLPVSTYDAASIEGAKLAVETETARLASLDLSDQTTTAALVSTAFTKMSEGDLEAAAAAMSAAVEKGAGGPGVDTLREKIETEAAAAAEAAEIAAKEAEKAERERMRAEAQAARDAEKAARDAAAAEKKKTPRQIRREKAEAAREAGETGGEGARSSGSSAAAEDDGGIPFSVMMLIIAGILAVVTIVAKVFMKPAGGDEGGE